MTLKIPKHRKPTKLKSKTNSPGWLQLTLDELIHWAHAWKCQQTNPDNLFREKESATALHFGCNRSTISRRNAALVNARVAKTLHEGERNEKTQWFVESTLCITTAPPACVLKLAEAAQEVRQALKSDSPCATLHTAQGCVNSGSEPCAELHDIATDSSKPSHQSVSIEGIHIGVVGNSSGVRANMHTAPTRINTGDEPCAELHTDPDIKKVERQLKDAESKLARQIREYGEGEAIVTSTRSTVNGLRSLLRGLTL